MAYEPQEIDYEDYSRYVDTAVVFIGLRKADNILFASFKPGVRITKDIQHWLLIVYNYVSDGKARPLVMEAAPFVEFTNEAKEYAVTIEEEAPFLCDAIIVRNMAQLLVAKLYFKLNRPLKPHNTFRDFESALAWAKTFSIE